MKDIFETVREPLLVLDADLNILSANRSFYNTFKVEQGETIGHLIFDVGNKQWDIPALRTLLEEILPAQKLFDNYEVEHYFPAIGHKTMLLNARQIYREDVGTQMILLAIEDITGRKRLEDLLRESEERYRRIFETASDGIVLFEKNEGHIVHANPAAEKMLGYSEEEYKGKMLKDIGVPLDMSDFPAIMQSLSRGGILNYDDVQVKTKSGHYIDTDIYMVDRASLAQCNIRDVTERKQEEKEKQTLREQLRHSQKMEAVGTLAGGIAHDFNNILNVIIGYGTMVMDKLEDGSPLKENANEVLIAAERAATLTKRLLLFSRKRPVTVSPVDINEVILDMQKMLVRTIREDIEFKLDLADRPLIVMADAGQIEQVLMNLATNARDAMPEGGRLTIGTGLEELDDEYVAGYGYGKPGTYALITVADTGHGMDTETRKKIFDPFYTTKAIGEGTGLGLAISYGIIKQHSGYIKAYSEPGQGTVFKISLPLSEEAVSLDNKPKGFSTKGGDETVLVAEDDADLRELAVIVLESLGYSVISAEDGEDAIAKFMENRERISLALLDMIMPKKSGKDVSEAIRKVSPRTKILFSTGYPTNSITTKELTDAGFDLIKKPFLPRDLLLKVREVLDR